MGELDGARHLRQILLPEIGREGQARLNAQRATVEDGTALARRIAADYLERSGLAIDASSSSIPCAVPTVDAPPELAPAADLLAGSFAAVETLKRALGVGEEGTLPPSLLRF